MISCGRELTHNWAFDEEDNHFLVVICCRSMYEDVGQLLESMKSFLRHFGEL